MSESVQMAPAAPIALDDIRHKALRIRSDVQDEIRETVSDRRNQIIAVGVIAFVAVIGVAYLAGAAASRRRPVEPRRY